MKKALYITMMVLAVAGSAFAQIAANPTVGPQTIDNFDSCDISNSPAASLLLPYFEVDVKNAAGRDTLFTITNVSDTPAVAHVTVWSNWSFPVLDFNIFLTGYDVQGVSMRDVLNGNLPATGIPTSLSPRGTRSQSNATGNPHRSLSAVSGWAVACNFNQGGPNAIPAFLKNAVLAGLTGGTYTVAGCQVGDDVAGDGSIAQGYVTIDVANTCSQSLPVNPAYFTGEILYDNQLIGDYIRFDASNNYASGTPLVHIKAIPPGGVAGAAATVQMPRTFYSRWQSTAGAAPFGIADRRQPLPALFATRYIDGNLLGFATNIVIWREGVTTDVDAVDCNAIVNNASIRFTETVRFDERENPTTLGTSTCPVSPCPQPVVVLSETQAVDINNGTIFPADPSSDPSGWLYLNMHNPNIATDIPAVGYGAGLMTQNWVITQMSSGGHFAVDLTAAYLSNGCTRGVEGVTAVDNVGADRIGPKYSNVNGALQWP